MSTTMQSNESVENKQRLQKSGKEELVIKKFFSIKHFEWDVNEFNVFTGGMASGKSLCIKLLFFFERAFDDKLFLGKLSKKTFDKKLIYKNIQAKFYKIFCVNDKDHDKALKDMDIVYKYSINDIVFDLHVKGTGEKDLNWSSEYIDNNIEKWRTFLENGQKAKEQIVQSFSESFYNKLPIKTLFVPAGRMAEVLSRDKEFRDPLVTRFQAHVQSIKNEKDLDELNNEIDALLGTEKFWIESTDKNRLFLKLSDGRTIRTPALSSGQQELLYLLLSIKDLEKDESLCPCSQISVFIEEPSAHLFPGEQKKIMEYLVSVFRSFKETEKTVRFFITTHSPYILNVINNMLKKGYLIKNISTCQNDEIKKSVNEEIESLSFQHLMVDEMSAYFIKKDEDVTSMINESENGSYLYEKIIEDITQNIDDDYNKVKRLLRRIKG